MANIGRAVTTYRELMQQQVHEEGYFVAVQYVGAVDGAAGARQVVGVHGGAEGPDAEEKTTESLTRGLRSADLGRKGLQLGCERLALGAPARTICCHRQEQTHSAVFAVP